MLYWCEFTVEPVRGRNEEYLIFFFNIFDFHRGHLDLFLRFLLQTVDTGK